MSHTLHDSDSSQADSTFPNLANTINDALNELNDTKDLQGLTGVPSGFIDLDRLLAGWQQSQLIVLASRPGMGKSSLLLSALRNAAVDFGQPVGLFSLETRKVKVGNRLIAAEVEVPLEKINKGTLAPHEWTQLSLRTQRLHEAPIFIDDTYDLNFEELRTKCLRMVKRDGVKVIAIDNIHLMLSTNLEESISEYEELSRIVRGLKKLSSELKVPIIALSQISRAVETRGGDKRPQMRDLRGSGAIEEHADVVMLLYRPEYYCITHDESGNSMMGIGEVIVAKNRNGGLGTVQLRFIHKYTKFCNLDSYFEPVPSQFSPPNVHSLSSFDRPGDAGGSPSAGSVFKSKAGNLSNFGNADPSQETPF